MQETQLEPLIVKTLYKGVPNHMRKLTMQDFGQRVRVGGIVYGTCIKNDNKSRVLSILNICLHQSLKTYQKTLYRHLMGCIFDSRGLKNQIFVRTKDGHFIVQRLVFTVCQLSTILSNFLRFSA